MNDPVFLSYSKLIDARFTFGSDMYYRRLLDKSYGNEVVKVRKKLTSDDPANVPIQLCI